MTGTSDPAPRHVVLTGAMGAGKTTVGRILAARLEWRLVDSDDQIEARCGMTGRRIAVEQGVERLHEAEARALWEALAADGPSVVAAAASVADDPGLIDLVASAGAFVVLLRGDAAVLASRTGTGGRRRPLLPDEAIRLARQRSDRLAGVAGLTVDVTRRSPDEVAGLVFSALSATG